MAKRGNKPTPTNVLLARGSWHGKTPERKLEVVPEPGLPRCPSWLRPAAKTEWRRLVPVLDYMGLLTHADRNVLAEYCQTWAKYKRAEMLMQTGKDQWDEVGPASRTAINLVDQLLKLGGKLGLSPSDRVGLRSEKPKAKKKETGPERFFKGGTG